MENDLIKLIIATLGVISAFIGLITAFVSRKREIITRQEVSQASIHSAHERENGSVSGRKIGLLVFGIGGLLLIGVVFSGLIGGRAATRNLSGPKIAVAKCGALTLREGTLNLEMDQFVDHGSFYSSFGEVFDYVEFHFYRDTSHIADFNLHVRAIRAPNTNLFSFRIPEDVIIKTGSITVGIQLHGSGKGVRYVSLDYPVDKQ